MTKAEKDTAAAAAAAQTGEQGVNLPAILDPAIQAAFDELSGEKMSMNAEYHEFTEGTEEDFIIESIFPTQIKGKDVVAVRMWKKDGSIVINASAVLVSAAKKLVLPAPVRVTVKGKKSNSVGSYFDLNVETPKKYYAVGQG